MIIRILVVLGLALLAVYAGPSHATYSIVACDSQGDCGAAVATNNLAVGATVIHARAGAGALATQFETNPNYGPKGLAMLAASAAPEAVVQRLLEQAGNFDGTGIAYRQVGVASPKGPSASYTGDEARKAGWAGSRGGDGYSVQGNGLASERVLQAMERAYRETKGPLAERLIAALEAGQAAGGQSTGRLSAALLVRTVAGDWSDIDLRVDAAAEPVSELRRLLDMRNAHQTIIRAERLADHDKPAEARAAIDEALRLGGRWDRIWRRAARLSVRMGDLQKADECLRTFQKINPVWAEQELRDPIYTPLRGAKAGGG